MPVINLERLKETDGLSSVASKSCEAYLSYAHTPAEIELARGISALLKSTLVKDPSKRPSILDLLRNLAEWPDGPRRTFRTSLGPAVQSGYNLETLPEPRPLAEMPLFDVLLIICLYFSTFSLTIVLVYSAP